MSPQIFRCPDPTYIDHEARALILFRCVEYRRVGWIENPDSPTKKRKPRQQFLRSIIPIEGVYFVVCQAP